MPDTNMPENNMSAAALAPYRVSAYNTAHDSENLVATEIVLMTD